MYLRVPSFIISASLLIEIMNKRLSTYLRKLGIRVGLIDFGFI